MGKQDVIIENYIKQKLSNYEKFMGYNGKLPIPQIVIEEYKTNASHNYKVETNSHTLTVGTNIIKKKLEPVLYHEFTHIYDVATISANNKIYYLVNRGYTEYHASQVELLKIIDAKTKNEKVPFSLKTQFETPEGKKPLINYILDSRKSARESLKNGTFLTNLEMFAGVLSMVFNHLGRVSICRLYAENYPLYKNELEDLKIEKDILGEEFCEIVEIATTFLDINEIVTFGNSYYKLIKKFMDENNL